MRKKELEAQLKEDAKNKALKKEVDEARMILKTFEVRELKHLLEANGHNPDPFINPYLIEFSDY